MKINLVRGPLTCLSAGLALLGGAARAQTRDAGLLKVGAYVVELKGTCEPGADRPLFRGDTAAEAALNDLQIPEQLAQKVSAADLQDNLRQALCDHTALTFPSQGDRKRTYLFMNKGANHLRRYFGWSEADVPEQEFQAFARAHEIGHVLVDRQRLAQLTGIDPEMANQSPIEEALADAFAICRATTTREAGPKTIEAFLTMRDELTEQDPRHATLAYLSEPLLDELATACRPTAARPDDRQLFKTASRLFLKHLQLN